MDENPDLHPAPAARQVRLDAVRLAIDCGVGGVDEALAAATKIADFILADESA